MLATGGISKGFRASPTIDDAHAQSCRMTGSRFVRWTVLIAWLTTSCVDGRSEGSGRSVAEPASRSTAPESRPMAVSTIEHEADNDAQSGARTTPSDSHIGAGSAIVAEARCITDVASHARARILRLRAEDPDPDGLYSDQALEPLEATADHVPMDIDRDGTPDRLFYYAWGLASGEYTLYLSNHGCQRFSDGFVASYEHLRILPRTYRGYATIETFGTDGCAGSAGTLERYRWTGRSWRSYETIECACLEERPRGTRNPTACPR